jgi:hypothetical protein
VVDDESGEVLRGRRAGRELAFGRLRRFGGDRFLVHGALRAVGPVRRRRSDGRVRVGVRGRFTVAKDPVPASVVLQQPEREPADQRERDDEPGHSLRGTTHDRSFPTCLFGGTAILPH